MELHPMTSWNTTSCEPCALRGIWTGMLFRRIFSGTLIGRFDLPWVRRDRRLPMDVFKPRVKWPNRADVSTHLFFFLLLMYR